MTKRWSSLLAVGLGVVMSLAGCAQQGGSNTTAVASTKFYTPATPESGTNIPSVTLKFGMRPYADNTVYVIGMEKGWFKDVGITIEPQPHGLKTTEDQWVSLLLSHQVDINSATCGILLPAYKTTDQLKCVGFADTFFGLVMLANPKLHLKTLSDYANEGLSFTDALKQALNPLVGQTVYVPSAITARTFDEQPFQLAGLPLPNYQTADDSQMLLLAKSDRLNFMNPSGAPIAEQLLEAGWTPIYDTAQLLRYGPGGVDSPLEGQVFNNGIAATADYVNAHQTTILRFESVMFRIFDSLQKDSSLYGVYTPYLNSVAGTTLSAAGVQHTVEFLDPFVSFEKQTKYFDSTSASEYYANSMGALIATLEKSSAIPTGVTPDELVWAAPIYHELASYKNKTDIIFESGKTKQLTSDKQRLLQQAQQYYAWYDFLDAYRFAQAAIS